MEKELLINGKLYKINMVNRRSKSYDRLEMLELPINLEEIYNKYEFGNVENIRIVRELLRRDSLNFNKDILCIVELYNAMVINSALLPYVLSCDVDIVAEFRKTLTLLKCYDELKNLIDVEISFLNVSQEVSRTIAYHVERNMLLRGYIMIRNNSEAIFKAIVKRQTQFHESIIE